MSSQQYQHRVVETVATKEARISCPLGGRVDPVLARSEITRPGPQPAEKTTVAEDNDEVGNPADNNDPRNGEAGNGVGSGGGGGALIKIQLPESLESLPRADHFPSQRHRWNTNEEIAAILISFDRHSEWLAKEVKIRPKSGSMLLYSRKKVRYRRDGYCWKKRKDGKTTREDHMKLKVQGTECIYGCYVHSAILPTFHRRCYWLLQNPDIVLVHYLNVPYPDDSKLVVVASVSLWGERKEWTKEELISQLKPMFFSEDEPNLNNELEISTAETVEAIVCQLMEKQRAARLANHAHPTVSTANSGPSKLATLTFSEQRNDNSPPVVTSSRLALPAPSTSCTDVFRGNKSNNAHPSAPVAVTHSSTRAFHVRHSADSNEALPAAVAENPAPRQQRPPSVSAPDLAAVNNNHDPRHAPLLLNLSQLQNAGGGLLILNSGSSLTSFLPMAASSSLHRWEPLPSEPSQSDSPGYRADVMQIPALPEKPSPDAHSDSKASSVQTAKSGVTFSETLDLTQEDIQQTLSANLPMYEDAGRHSHLHQDMLQFLDVSGNHDDLFANLDAFDMLADLPEFDCHDHTTTDIPIKSESISLRSPETLLEKPPEKRFVNSSHHAMVNIVDYSPEWSPTEGGTKVLVTGPWQTVAGWTILFGDTPAPATLIQHGVLRCYTPSHPAGEVTLQVARDGLVVSNSVCFTYRSTTVASRASSSADQALLHCKLLQRLRQVTDGLDLENGPLKTNLANLEEKFRNVCHADTDEWRQFEDSLASLCLQWKNRPWKRNYAFSLPAGDSSLLHLASALGLTRVASSLIEWRLDNSALVLEQEVNVLGRDSKGFTPLMWSCAKGHHDMAALLAQYEPAALVVVDAQGRNPSEVARQAGFVLLAADIESRRILGARSPSEMPVPSRSSSISGGKNDKGRGIASRPSFHSPSPSPSPQLGPPTSAELMWNADGTRQVRLAKRSSMDNTTPTSHAAMSSDWQRKSDKNHKLSRNDRSLSLPLGALPPIDDRHRERSPAFSMDATSVPCELAPVLLPPRPQPIARTATPPLPPATADLDASNVMLTDPCSPLIDVEALSEHEPESPLSQPIEDGVQNIRRESASSVDLALPGLVGDQDTRVLTLAEQIIAAMPDRIKNESEDMVVEDHVGEMTVIDLKTDDLLMEEEATDPAEFTFEFSDHNYRYCDIGTPSSSVSPASSSCLQSPCSFSMDSPSPPPTTADFTEFLQASSNVFVRDFSNLTLSDREQRELYEAAKIIQKAYRSYKGRKKAEEQDKERTAAIIIQNYYRRYKQYVYLKQMTRAAVVIQNQFRSYYEHKRFKKSQESSSSTPSVCSPSSYRLFRENSLGGNGRQSREGTPTSSALKRTYSQRRQHQAARKIQQFMRQSKNKLQRERALAAERANQTNSSNINVGCPHHTPTCACSVTPPTSANSNRRI